jgi:AcrR family transcriptional regulator
VDEFKEYLDKLLNDPHLTEDELTERQWQILEAAISVFAEKGFEASRTSEIAKKAEIAEGTIFRYFKTKKDLLLGLFFPLVIKVFRPLYLRPVEKIMENQEHLPIEKVLKEIYLDRLRLIRKHLPLLKTVLVESSYHPEMLHLLREEIVPRVVSLLEGFVQQKMDEGVFRPLNPRLVARSFVSMLMGYIILTQMFPELFSLDDDEKEMEDIVDILLHGFLRKDHSGEESP